MGTVNGSGPNTVNLAPLAATPMTGVSYTAPAAASLFFGSDAVNLTATGYGQTEAATRSTEGPLYVNVVGLATRAGADGAGVRGTYARSSAHRSASAAATPVWKRP